LSLKHISKLVKKEVSRTVIPPVQEARSLFVWVSLPCLHVSTLPRPMMLAAQNWSIRNFSGDVNNKLHLSIVLELSVT